MDQFSDFLTVRERYFKKIAYKEITKEEFLNFHANHQTQSITTLATLPILQKPTNKKNQHPCKKSFSHLYL